MKPSNNPINIAAISPPRIWALIMLTRIVTIEAIPVAVRNRSSGYELNRWHCFDNQAINGTLRNREMILKDIADLTGGRIIGNSDVIISGVSGITEAKDGDIVLPGRVLVAPGGKHIFFEEKKNNEFSILSLQELVPHFFSQLHVDI